MSEATLTFDLETPVDTARPAEDVAECARRSVNFGAQSGRWGRIYGFDYGAQEARLLVATEAAARNGADGLVAAYAMNASPRSEPAFRSISISDLARVEVDLGLWYDHYHHLLGEWDPARRGDHPVFPGAPRPLAPVEAPDRAAIARAPRAEFDLADERARLAAEAEDLLGYTPLRDAVKVPGRLARALARLEIDALDQDAVDAYKARMVAHYDSMNKMEQPTWRLTALADYALPVPEYVLRKAVAIKRELPDARFWVDQLDVDPFLIVSVGDREDDPADHVVNVTTRGLDPETAAYVEAWDEPAWEREA